MVDAGVKVLFCGEEFPAAAGRALTIGRSGDVEIDDNPYLHRSFLVIVDEGGLWWLSNVGSTLTVTVADDKGLFHAWLSPGARIPLAFNRVLVWFTAGPTTYDFEIVVDNPAFASVAPDPAGVVRLGGIRCHRGKGRVVDDDLEVVGGRPGGEPDQDPVERQGDPGTRRKPRVEQPLVVRNRHGQRRADVGQPPQAALVDDHQEAAVQVRVVIDLHVSRTPDRQRPTGRRRELFTAEKDLHPCIDHARMLTRGHRTPADLCTGLSL